MVAEKGLGLVSIKDKDHDTIDGLEEDFRVAERFPDLRIVSGVELDCEMPGADVHILEYFLNHRFEDFQIDCYGAEMEDSIQVV